MTVTALALCVRLLGIASRSLWYDEAFAVLFSEKGPSAMLAGTLATTGAAAADVHPLAYYTTLWLWMQAWGQSPIAVRALSVLAGLGVVLVVGLLAKSIFAERTALAAALIVALSPFQVHYSQEIRMYVFMALWLLLATYCYWRGSESGQWAWWAGFAVFGALAQYTHNLSAFYLAAIALWPAITRNWRALRSTSLAAIAAVVLYIPWLVHLPAQFAKVQQAYWITRPDLSRLMTLLVVFVTNLPLPGWELAAGLYVTVYIAVLAVVQTLRERGKPSGVPHAAWWMLYLSFAPPMLLFGFSQWRPIYLERALLPSGAIFCIWLAWVMMDTGMRRPIQILTTLLLAFGFGLGLYEHATYSGFPYAPFDRLTRNLESRLKPGDVIVHSNKLSLLPAAYYDRNIRETFIGDPPGSGVDTLAPSTQQVLGLEAEANIESATQGASRVWFIIFDQSLREYQAAGFSTNPQITWLLAHYRLLENEQWDSLWVYLFSNAPGG